MIVVKVSSYTGRQAGRSTVLASSEAFTMDNTCTAFLFIFWLLDKHRIKALHWWENGTSKPSAMLSIGRRVNTWLQVRGSQCLNFLLHAFFHSLEHCAASSEYDISEQILPDVTLTLDNCIVGVLVNTILVVLHLSKPVVWLEQNFWALKTRSIDLNCLGTWQLILLGGSAIVARCF